MKVGLLATAFECENELDQVLQPWCEYNSIFGGNLIKSIVSAQFKQYSELGYKSSNEATIDKLNNLKWDGTIQYLSTTEELLEEWEVRNLALKPLLEEKCDLIFLLDCQDEVYNSAQIDKAIKYVQKEDNQFYSHFKIEFKNYIGDKKRYVRGFTPNRIWRTKMANGLTLQKLHYDNNGTYLTKDGQEVKDDFLPVKLIPFNIIAPQHFSWLSDERSKKKIAFQEKRWSYKNKLGNGCGFKWNEQTNSVEFNLEYHKRLNIPIPEIFCD
jgi:hypothetical protein